MCTEQQSIKQYKEEGRVKVREKWKEVGEKIYSLVWSQNQTLDRNFIQIISLMSTIQLKKCKNELANK